MFASEGSLMYRAKNEGRIAMILCNMMVVNLREERCTQVHLPRGLEFTLVYFRGGQDSDDGP